MKRQILLRMLLKDDQSELPADATSMVDEKLYDLEYGYA